MNTAESLRQEFGTQFPRLEKVAPVYLDIKGESTLSRQAAQGRFPFPVFKASDSNKAPWLVDVKELARHLDERSKRAAETSRSD